MGDHRIHFQGGTFMGLASWCWLVVGREPAGGVVGWGWVLGPGSSPYARSHPWRLDSKVEAPGQDGVLVRQPWESQSILSIVPHWSGLHPAGPRSRGGATGPSTWSGVWWGAPVGWEAPRQASWQNGKVRVWGAGSPVPGRFLEDAAGTVYGRSLPQRALPSAVGGPRAHFPPHPAKQCPFPFASPARDLRPMSSNCSLCPKEHTYFPLPKRRTWPSQAAARDSKEARWPAFSHTGPRQRGAVCTLEKQQQLWGFFPMSYFQITALFRTSSETCRSFPGGPVAENPSCNAGEVGFIPDRGTKISSYGAVEPACCNDWARGPWLESTHPSMRDPACRD